MADHEPLVDLREPEYSIDFSKLEHRPCICGGEIYCFVVKRERRWVCNSCCGAAGKSYKGALREKVKLDLVGIEEKTRNFLKEAHISL